MPPLVLPTLSLRPSVEMLYGAVGHKNSVGARAEEEAVGYGSSERGFSVEIMKDNQVEMNEQKRLGDSTKPILTRLWFLQLFGDRQETQAEFDNPIFEP